MDHEAPIKPFRWNLAKREQLGALAGGDTAQIYAGFYQHLRVAAALVLARAGDSDLVFVGRSPECLFDYLSGILDGVAQAPSLTFLHFSAPREPVEEVAKIYAAEFNALLSYFVAERIDPLSVATYGKQVRFIDVVASGRTFGTLVDYMRYWGKGQGADWNVVQRRIGFVGITCQDRASPNVWRWWQHQPWVAELTKTPITNVSMPWPFWSFIANNNQKVTPSHWVKRWASLEATAPRRDDHHLQGLRLALEIYDRGRDADEREKFVRALTELPEMRQAWLRSLVLRLRGVAA